MIQEILFYSILVPVVITTLISIYNLFTAPVIYNKDKPVEEELISVLIPARNEAKNIGNCLSSLINQSYKNLEIIVLNDHSADDTERVVLSYAEDKRVKLINGLDLPQDWLGKNWACSQLSKAARGKILLFIDADVTLKEHAIVNAYSKFLKRKVKMLSLFPTQKIKSFGNHLITPLMNWLLLTFLPLKKVYSSKNKSFVAANGQFIMIDKNTYTEIGGHESVRSKVVEDMEIARKLKSLNHKIITCVGGDAVFCNMYNSFEDGVTGFSKNFYKGFNVSPFVFVFIFHFFLFLYFVPALLSLVNFTYIYVVVLIIIGRVAVSITSRQNILMNVFLHLPQMLIMYMIGWKSLLNTLNGNVEWKGRKIK